MPVEMRKQGLQLIGTPLFLDARRKTELSFVSHAHADHIGRHERTIATAATLRLMTHRLGKLKAPLPAPYNRPFDLGPLSIELLPAGHVLGSAQIRVIREDGTRVVYTGDLNLVPSLTAEAAQVAECDVLILESTFGHPRYVFPPKLEVLGKVESWARANLERGVTPVLLAYPLGKSQEAMAFLGRAGLDLRVHPAIHDIAQIYGELGTPLERMHRYSGTIGEGEVGIFPPHAARFGRLARLRRSTAVLTGWALDPGAARRYGADVAFPLSDHADFPSLMSYARATGATEVITHHGFSAELASALRAEGILARAIGRPLQMELFAA